MKNRDSWPNKGVRLLCYALVATAYVLLLAALSGCGFVTEAMRATGLPVSSAAVEAAKAVDSALGGWVWALLGIAGSEGTRAATRTVKRRAQKRTEHREAERRADEIINAKVT